LTALANLRQRYPHDDFEALMKFYTIDPATKLPVKSDQRPPPINVKYQYLPRIKCNDCPGKLYSAGTGLTTDNFEVHLKNRLHKEKVEERKKGGS
jgi:SWI/SNF-related matrix-associated actin-dependent regulator of chromatin subfamily B member 1